jgi:hypothetical protein
MGGEAKLNNPVASPQLASQPRAAPRADREGTAKLWADHNSAAKE